MLGASLFAVTLQRAERTAISQAVSDRDRIAQTVSSVVARHVAELHTIARALSRVSVIPDDADRTETVVGMLSDWLSSVPGATRVIVAAVDRDDALAASTDDGRITIAGTVPRALIQPDRMPGAGTRAPGFDATWETVGEGALLHLTVPILLDEQPAAYLTAILVPDVILTERVQDAMIVREDGDILVGVARGGHVAEVLPASTPQILSEERGAVYNADGFVAWSRPIAMTPPSAAIVTYVGQRGMTGLAYLPEGTVAWFVALQVVGVAAGVLLAWAMTSRSHAFREAMEASSHDGVTGLPSRRVLLELGGRAIGHAARNGRAVACLYADVPRFRAINERYGLEVGDRVLAEVARRVRAIVRGYDVVSRIDADHFVILMTDLPDTSPVDRIARDLSTALEDPIESGAVTVQADLSVGIAAYPHDALDLDALIAIATERMVESRGVDYGPSITVVRQSGA